MTLLRGLSRTDLLCNVPFILMWLVLAFADLVLRGDWSTALAHFWTGIFLAAFVTRQQVSHRQLLKIQREYQKLSDDSLRTMLLAAAILQQQQADPKQMREHLAN